MAKVLRTENLKKYYGEAESQVRALDGVDFSVEQGEFVAVVGTSGSGKSTLLHMLGGLDRPTSGKVWVDDKDIFGLKDDALCIFRRRKIGFVFQNYNLVPVLNVYENIVLPIELDGNTVDQFYVQEVIQALGLESKCDSLPSQLSGGQQRVAIARALATKPAILLADEPTGNLDSATSQDVLGLMKMTGERFSQTIVMITHDEELAQLSDRIIRIEDGKIKGTKNRNHDIPEERMKDRKTGSRRKGGEADA
ncbi:MAG: ABC transporter ATP-binding protein [Hespellia sp.]|nr:ABC transporter ATP-binding protein [Hespellia sp.]